MSTATLPETEATTAEALAPPVPAATAPRTPPVTPPDHIPWPISLAAYEKLGESGVFGDVEGFDRVYLWEGRLCQRMSRDRPHVYGVKSLYDALRDLKLEGYEPESEAPMALRFADSAPSPTWRSSGERRGNIARCPGPATWPW